MAKKENHILHNIGQYFVAPLLIAYVSLNAFPSLDRTDVLVVSFLGSMLPDVDHINIWLEYKFKDFQSFVKFLMNTRRYRYSFLIFHNIIAILALLLLIPIVANRTLLGGIFLFSCLVHILQDFFDDKISIGRVTHWRYRRRT